jgi:raffinose/stachyose/melibiose transport system permease protein
VQIELKQHFQSPRVQTIALLVPAIGIYALFAVYPILDLIVLSFQKWNGLDPERRFVALDNYVFILTKDPVFWGSLRNTVIWTVMSLILPPLVGLLLALSLNQQIFGRGGLRAIFYMPVIIAPIAVATMWRWMYDPFFGLFNQVLPQIGIDVSMMDWLGNRNSALYSVFVAYLWQSTGFSMVLFLAGLQNVSQTLVEAARIDGAGRWQVFRFVTLPALRTSVTIVLVLAVISSLKAFDIVYGMTGGGPAQSTQMLALWAFTQSMQIFDFGRGAAISVVLLLISAMIVVPYLRWTQKHDEVQ